MAKSVRSSQLETRTNRLKLPITSKPFYVRIGPGMSLGYRRNRTAGMWVKRVADGKGGMVTQSIAHADDFDESNGQSILNFYEAQDMARRLAAQSTTAKPLTVGEAAANYLTVLETRNRRTAYDTRLRLQKHFLPHFTDKLVTAITKTQLEKWLAGLVDMENERASKDSANRVLTMAKALLNHALQDQSHGIKDDSAWRFVKPFKSVGQARSIRYSYAEIMKIVDNAPDKATGSLIMGVFLTGTRYGEVIDSTVSSMNLNTGNWRVSGKTGSRDIILQREAIEFFRQLTTGKSPADLIFTMENGQPWKASDQTRPFKNALAGAGLPTDGSMYALRHSYISTAIEGGAPLNLIAENCGTSVRMIEKTYSHLFVEKRRSFIEAAAPSFGK
jgi:site-specific recombinase XerD